MTRFLAKSLFYLRYKLINRKTKKLRAAYWRTLGMHIGRDTFVDKLICTWPHKVTIGDKCTLEHSVFFKLDGIYSPEKAIIIGDNTFIGNHAEFNISKTITIGDNCLIAAGCKFIDHDHGTDKERLICYQPSVIEGIVVGSDVWLGVNAVILKGVRISEGVVVAAGAVVTKSIPPYEIWGGVPAKKIGERK